MERSSKSLSVTDGRWAESDLAVTKHWKDDHSRARLSDDGLLAR